MRVAPALTLADTNASALIHLISVRWLPRTSYPFLDHMSPCVREHEGWIHMPQMHTPKYMVQQR